MAHLVDVLNTRPQAINNQILQGIAVRVTSARDIQVKAIAHVIRSAVPASQILHDDLTLWNQLSDCLLDEVETVSRCEVRVG